MAHQPQPGWMIRRREQRNTVSQQYRYNAYLDGVNVAGIEKRAKQLATAK